jgi:hypothetical protein
MCTKDELLPSVGLQFEILAQISRIVGVVNCTLNPEKVPKTGISPYKNHLLLYLLY